MKVLQQNPADERPHQSPQREGGAPDADRPVPLVFVREEIDHKGQGRWRECRAGDAEQRARNDELLRRARERGERVGARRGLREG